jgi:hypothetical protein
MDLQPPSPCRGKLHPSKSPTLSDVDSVPAADATDAWRAKFVDYYQQNAPTKVKMVNDSMMDKWAGKYEALWNNLVKKYGPLGKPKVQPPAAPAKGKGRGGGKGGGKGGGFGGDFGGRAKPTISDFADDFVALVTKATPQLEPRASTVDVVNSKANNSENGLETSSFTVCTRVRPLLEHEIGQGGEYFTAVVPGVHIDGKSGEHSEEVLVLQPKMSVMGKPKLESSAHTFDYVFGPESTNKEIYELVGQPLIRKALNGQVGVIFAYGQTGSGKTHTMNGIMDGLLASSLFQPGQNELKFSYIGKQRPPPNHAHPTTLNA